MGADALHAHSGPAAEAAQEHAQEFAEERKRVAPEQNPKDGSWVPGDAPSQVSHWAVEGLAKAGTLGIIGVYPPQASSFPIGQAMNKNLTINMGNCNHRTYIPHLVDLVRMGGVKPTEILSKVEAISSAVDAYKAFDKRQPGWLKVELMPQAAE